MKIDASFLLRPEQGFNSKDCVFTFIIGQPLMFHRVDLRIVIASGIHQLQHTFNGCSFTVRMNEMPTAVTVVLNGRVVNRFEDKQLEQLNSQTQLRILIDLLLAEHPHRLQSRNELN